MTNLNLASHPECASSLPIRAIQFGEGNFLRGFIDWMIFKLNQNNLFNGRILALQNTPRGRVVPKLLKQDCLYTTILHGIEDGKPVEYCEIINAIGAAMNPYAQWNEILEQAKLDTVKFIFSNTTEAGITYAKEENLLGDAAPATYPGKLTALLYARFKHYQTKECKCGAGLVIVPCELIDNNGTKLKDIVLQHIADAGLEDEFKAYVLEDCRFLNTLVDRVVSGYPTALADEYKAKLGYDDELMACGETFGFMAIEGDDEVSELLPFAKIGLNVTVAPDINPYRLRKVRILNGGHTSNVPGAFLAGLDTVDQMMTDEVTGPSARAVIYDEIIPAVNLDKGMLTEFADAVVNRFMDPSMHHMLASILMNSTSKVKARVVPSIVDALAKGVVPSRLCFALAAYLCLYQHAGNQVPVKVQRADGKSGEFVDDAYAVSALTKAWELYQGDAESAAALVKAVFGDKKLFDEGLEQNADLVAKVAAYTDAIVKNGAKAALKAI